MRFVRLVSGGKDSIYAIIEAIRAGHALTAVANLTPPDIAADEIDSFMYQTIGHNVIGAIAECLDVPLFRRPIRGAPVCTHLQYDTAPAAATTATTTTTAAAATAPATALAPAPASDEVE